MGFANRVQRGIEMPLVGSPPISVKARDTKRFQQGFQLEKHVIFAPSKDIR
jgi:hypothetical protein